MDNKLKTIIITGGLGYIGTELCRIYSGISWKHNIIVVDNNFYSERVEQLRKWNIKYYNFNILSKDKKFKDLIKSADVIHHLAGITNVAYTKNEELKNNNQAKLVENVAINGTRNIINFSNETCKIIFPSTHVIFDGLADTKKNISENYKPLPQLIYSKSKYQNELDIQSSGRNYIILRLGSVYGYSGDSTRINIMPNLFSRFSSTSKVIKLFSKGKQLKSLVPLVDVARCFKFFEENSQFKKEIYNVAKENISVKEVAKICKKICPDVNLISTSDVIPNLGYTLSNKKLLRTGFKFLYNLESCLKEMIEKWSEQNLVKSIEYLKKGENEFIDNRGKISNFELPEPINLIGYIESKKNSVRANHYHPIQEQKCLVIRGQYISVLKDLLDENSLTKTFLVNEGDLVVTRPNVAHAMIFTKDTIFLNLVRGEREHKNYGVTHTIKKIIVDDKLKKKLLLGYKVNCRCCGNYDLKRVISLGFQPLANNLVDSNKIKPETYPLELNYCKNCFNCQLSFVVEPKKMFENYLYMSSTTKIFKNHFKTAALKYVHKFNLNKKKSFIIDIGSNDGIALLPFKKLKFKNLLGIEPAQNLAEIAEKKGIKTLISFFNSSVELYIKQKAKLILASNVFAHSDAIDEMATTMKNLLEEKGIIIIEVQYLINTLKDLTFDNIYHEHVNYWSLHSLNFFFNKHAMKIFDVEKINTHGGSIRVYISKDLNIKINQSVKKILNEELKMKINNFETFRKFKKKIQDMKIRANNNLQNLKKIYSKIIGYGAPAKASTIINFFGIGKYFNFILEDNYLKFNKFLVTSQGNIKVLNKKNYLKDKKDKIIVLAWNFFNYIKKNNRIISDQMISIKSIIN